MKYSVAYLLRGSKDVIFHEKTIHKILLDLLRK